MAIGYRPTLICRFTRYLPIDRQRLRGEKTQSEVIMWWHLDQRQPIVKLRTLFSAFTFSYVVLPQVQDEQLDVDSLYYIDVPAWIVEHAP